MVSPLKDKQEMLRDLDSITQTLIIHDIFQCVKFIMPNAAIRIN
jgi:hypothetical protein